MSPLRGAGLLVLVAGLCSAELGQVAVNDYTGVGWTAEPVSWDVAKPAAGTLGLAEAAAQAETLPDQPGKVRLWTLVDLPTADQRVFTLTDAPSSTAAAMAVTPAEPVRGLPTVIIGNAAVQVRVPAAGKDFGPLGISPFAVPGPVIAIRYAGVDRWVGDSWLEHRRNVQAIDVAIERGPVFTRATLTYRIVGGGTWTARVRVWNNDKPFAEIVEDSDLGGDARWVFTYGDWAANRQLRSQDGGYGSHPSKIEGDNPAGDYITVEGQQCLSRLVVWTQFGYFQGKNETIGLFADDDSLFVGACYIRPDRWTRAKVNHVDLYRRPEVPGRPETRGVVGMAGAVPRIAMEAWLVAGHREWAIFANPGRDRDAEAKVIERNRDGLTKRIENLKANKGKKPLTPEEIATQVAAAEAEIVKLPENTYRYPPFIAKAHIRIGVWPLDRLNRMPLVWNADGSQVPIPAQKPRGKFNDAGVANRMFLHVEGRGGLAMFNGSEGFMRGGMIGFGRGYETWAKTQKDLKAADVDVSERMAGPALAAYMGMDESAYPGRRAMLPWTDPEALNPFYQGMENMNFNADRYASVAAVGAGLKAAGHPEGDRILGHGREQIDMALGRYIYPESGCWEESHGYCAHTMKNATTLARTLLSAGATDLFADRRFAALFGFWSIAHSPRDPGFAGKRIPPPIGDHGISVDGFTDQITAVVGDFAKAKDEGIQRTARNLAWLLAEKQAPVPAGLTPEAPDLKSRYLQGYGAALRSIAADGAESYAIVRAEQSWGHHHMDKGSLWFWGRNVHFFGDAAWGGPPGPTYGNDYKQGPASGTQLEFVGITNWTLPCKYPAPWIADDAYGNGLDYVMARCEYPFNPDLDLTKPTPGARRIGYDRQVLFVHGDLLVVRDNVESTVPTIWRLHSYQVDGTTIDGAGAVMASPQGVTGHLQILSPAGARLTAVPNHDGNRDKDGKPLDLPFGSTAGVDAKGKPTFDTRSLGLRWDMPINTSATWTFAVQGSGQPVPATELLDPAGRVVRARLADGREVIVLMNGTPFTWQGVGITFQGQVGVVVRAAGATTVHKIRAETLTVP